MPLTSTKNLPENYALHKTLDLRDKKSMIALNLIAIGFLFPLIYLFNEILDRLRPELTTDSAISISLSLTNIISIIALVSATILIHELIHGLFFWIYTQEKPEYAFKGLYAYAAAPEWYIPKAKFTVVGLSPFILITISVIILLLIVPTNLVKFVSVAGIFNAAGSIGDFFVIGWIVLQPNGCLVRDSGDSFSIYFYQDNLEQK